MRTRNGKAAKNAKKTAAGKIAPSTTNLINDFKGASDKESTGIDAPEEVIEKK